ncbi:MAG: NAD-dependent protein deacetylase [Corynebacterium variabile]|uniref:Sir2 family NAD-dependent protein deacetylase n=1 Tax=Corynebacterium variabile TaxID=1727 RepID=UPI002648B9E0|nr:Sir2 family NAD-dependent protein deacetylase [Corynebacterium variabile]MDN6536356.1 NAD-dependent protein deacetylase [Corynebacterium variabile]
MALPDAVTLAHRSALRSIARVVEETGTHSDPDVALRSVASQLRQGGVLVITGAGVSTDSGIPDYRGPQGSLGRHRPMTYQEFRHDPAASHRYWARSFVGWREMASARPNATHYAVAELEDAGMVSGVVTQNVDGLHAFAGSRNLLTLHGDLARVICLECGHTEDRRLFDARLEAANPGYLEEIRLDPTQVNPDGDVTLDAAHVEQFRMVGCEVCGSVLLKPDVVYFGEPVPVARRERAAEMVEKASSVLVAGSSLAVMSGYRLVLDAQQQGKQVSVINGGPGRADAKVDVLWRTSVAPAFLDLLDELGLE